MSMIDVSSRLGIETTCFASMWAGKPPVHGARTIWASTRFGKRRRGTPRSRL